MNSEKSNIENLVQEGWTKQFAASEPRLSEAVEMYKKAGFEVHLEPLPPANETAGSPEDGTNGECRQCFEGFEDQYRIIFTRPNKDGSSLDDDLF
jgi:hypothetical protein